MAPQPRFVVAEGHLFSTVDALAAGLDELEVRLSVQKQTRLVRRGRTRRDFREQREMPEVDGPGWQHSQYCTLSRECLSRPNPATAASSTSARSPSRSSSMRRHPRRSCAPTSNLKGPRRTAPRAVLPCSSSRGRETQWTTRGSPASAVALRGWSPGAVPSSTAGISFSRSVPDLLRSGRDAHPLQLREVLSDRRARVAGEDDALDARPQAGDRLGRPGMGISPRQRTPSRSRAISPRRRSHTGPSRQRVRPVHGGGG